MRKVKINWNGTPSKPYCVGEWVSVWACILQHFLQFQLVLIFLKFVYPCLLYICFNIIYIFFKCFEHLFCMFHSTWWQLTDCLNFKKVCDTAPLMVVQFCFISDNQSLNKPELEEKWMCKIQH